MSFYTKYIQLCNSIGKSPSAVAQELSLSKSTVSSWKNGGGVTDAKKMLVADYFGVDPDYFNEPQGPIAAATLSDPAIRAEIEGRLGVSVNDPVIAVVDSGSNMVDLTAPSSGKKIRIATPSARGGAAGRIAAAAVTTNQGKQAPALSKYLAGTEPAQAEYGIAQFRSPDFLFKISPDEIVVIEAMRKADNNRRARVFRELGIDKK